MSTISLLSILFTPGEYSGRSYSIGTSYRSIRGQNSCDSSPCFGENRKEKRSCCPLCWWWHGNSHVCGEMRFRSSGLVSCDKMKGITTSRVVGYFYYYITYMGGTPSLVFSWVKVFRIIPEFRILRLTFQRKSASESWIHHSTFYLFHT